MEFDIIVPIQSTILEREIKVKMYSGLLKEAHKTEWIRLAGFAVGLASSVLTIIFRIAQIGEALIKALGNLFGAICSKNCSWRLGFWNLFVVFPLSIIDFIASPFHGVIGSAVTTLGIAVAPSSYSTKRVAVHAAGLGNSLICQL